MPVTLVSVVVCAYNAASTLEAALDSAMTQSLRWEDYEVLLVDDGSTDRTPELVGVYGKQYLNFRYIRLPVNKGLAAACNAGLAAAQGKYFIRLDADDAFHRDILASCVGPLEQDVTDLVYCDRYEVNLAGGTHELVRVEPFSLFKLIAIGTMMRADMVKEAGGYRPLFWEEYDLYIRYLQRSGRPPIRIPRPLCYYSRHPSSMTANPERARAGWEELMRVWGEDVLRSFGWTGQE